MNKRFRNIAPDLIAVLLLILLWLVFFWRLFTPIPEDQLTIKEGDFSGQFFTFAGYQYDRFTAGEVPLWNPYNNAGLSFIGDTQAAVFYPPRLITIALSNLLSNTWSYHALELEMTFHVLLYSLLMYLFVRRLTLGQKGSVFGGFVAAIVVAYGGFTSGYPQQQLALLEAAVWLPLAATGILEATRRPSIQWRYLFLTGAALGLSWMAGHPQTSWFLTYLLVIYFAYRVYAARYSWIIFITGTALFGIVAVGATAVQLLPGFEYLQYTTRSGMGFDAKGNGFPYQDIMQFILPGSVSLFSPLYVGIPALFLGFIAVYRKLPQSVFWLSVFVVALLFSFGAHSALYQALYNVVPGLRFFRGQERSAFLVANSLAILAGMGAAYLVNWRSYDRSTRTILNVLLGVSALLGVLAVGTFVGWVWRAEIFGNLGSTAMLSAVVAFITWFLIRYIILHPNHTIAILLLGAVLVFELFSVNIGAESNFDPIPHKQQISVAVPQFLDIIQQDTDQPFLVDGFRGLTDNYGSLYQIADIRGISPLFLDGANKLIYHDYINNPLAWELFAVKYVLSEQGELVVPTDIINEAYTRLGHVFIHQIEDPRPFAHLLYDVVIDDDVLETDELLYNTDLDTRNTVVVATEPSLEVTLTESESPGNATVSDFQPEHITITTSTADNAILSLALPYYTGWYATLDGEPAEILRAYGALSAVAVPAGEHMVELTYDPTSYRIGAIMSIITWLVLAAVAIFAIFQWIRNKNRES